MKSSLAAIVLALFLMVSCATPPGESNEPGVERKDWALAIHGGAGVISRNIADEVRDGYLASLERAVRLGEQMLAEGRSALDVVEAVVMVLEDDPYFNAGVGAVYTSEAAHELDAAIMDGRDLNAGAVAGLRTVRNPITMARYIMEETPHVFFAGPGAEQLADRTDLPRVDNTFFNTENRRQQLERAVQRASLSPQVRPLLTDLYGTVGAVALDREGNLAAATSTGGMTNKMPGRVGDVPVIGAGTYANNQTAAISATGHGEKFIRNVVAYQISAIMEYQGLSLAEAADRVINGKLDQGDGGIIAVDRHGNISMTFNSPGMFRGAADSWGHFEVAIWD
jgi:L-asparaginase / beta-aspartyl-peptidase